MPTGHYAVILLTFAVDCVTILSATVNHSGLITMDSKVICILLITTQLTSANVLVDYVINEELEIGFIVGNLMDASGLSLAHDMDAGYEFSFLDDDQHLFAVDARTGVLRTASRVDRDVICQQTVEDCLINVDVIVKPVEVLKILKVRITIMDINDHRPKFPIDVERLSFSESTGPGTSFHIPAAQDADSGTFGIQSYTLYPTSDVFEITVVNTMDGSSELKLTLIAEVDREIKDSYIFHVVAQDGGDPSRSGRLQIIIEIEDENDNTPEFANVTLSIDIQENFDHTIPLAVLKAVDPDAGANGDVSYRFSPRTFQAYQHIFHIGNTTGTVYAHAPLDHEVASRYILAVTASDGGVPARASQMTLIVNVLDLNDNPPVVTVNTLTTGEAAEVSENAALGTFIAFMSVKDEDSGRNGLVTCDINGQGFALHEVYAGQYKIITTIDLDRERDSFYTVSLNCFDSGEPIRMGSVTLTILVTDENDHAPIFAQQNYVVKVNENNNVDDVIAKINATDADSGNNGEIRYALHVDDEVGRRLLNINPISGVLTAKAIFDRETLSTLELSILAYDLGTPALTTTSTVQVQIVDQNDEAPQFGMNRYDFYVAENLYPEALVGHLLATDADGPPFNSFEYQIHDFTIYDDINGTGTGTTNFKIDAINGKITTLHTLDREQIAVYSLQVWAVNYAEPIMTTTVDVLVHVHDENDNTPVFIYPTDVNNTAYIASNPKRGAVFAYARAVDYDEGDNADLYYQLISQTTDLAGTSIFYIDEHTGGLTVSKDNLLLTDVVYTLKVSVSDQGRPSRSTSTMLTVVVDDELAVMEDFVFPYSSEGSLLTDRFTILVAILSGECKS